MSGGSQTLRLSDYSAWLRKRERKAEKKARRVKQIGKSAPGGRVEFQKRHGGPGLSFNEVAKQMGIEVRPPVANGHETVIALAKMVVARGEPVSMQRSDFYTQLVAGGEAIRKAEPGLTPEQAFARFATETEEGKILMKASRLASGPEVDPEVAGERRSERAGPVVPRTVHSERLTELAAELRQEHPEMTEAQSVDAAMKTPKGRRLYALDRSERLAGG